MNYYISHSAKGTTWSDHKYVKKVGNRYYYKDDLARGAKKANAEMLVRYNQQKMAEGSPVGTLWRTNNLASNALKAKMLGYEQYAYDNNIFNRPFAARLQYTSLNQAARLQQTGSKWLNTIGAKLADYKLHQIATKAARTRSGKESDRRNAAYKEHKRLNKLATKAANTRSSKESKRRNSAFKEHERLSKLATKAANTRSSKERKRRNLAFKEH